jgi:histidine ammonia-lyase
MAAHGARRLKRMTENLAVIVGVELLCAAQGVEFRAPLATSAPLRKLIATLRAAVPPLAEDRYMADDIARAAAQVRNGSIAEVCGLPALLESDP